MQILILRMIYRNIIKHHCNTSVHLLILQSNPFSNFHPGWLFIRYSFLQYQLLRRFLQPSIVICFALLQQKYLPICLCIFLQHFLHFFHFIDCKFTHINIPCKFQFVFTCIISWCYKRFIYAVSRNGKRSYKRLSSKTLYFFV